MPSVFKVEGAIAEQYHGCGYALAAVTGGEIIALVYLRDVLEEFDDEDAESVQAVINDERLGPTVRYLSGLGEVFVGMCSCYEFVEL